MDLGNMFPTPAEEVDLTILKSEINRTYRTAFETVRHLVPLHGESTDQRNAKIAKIVYTAIDHVNQLCDAHHKKHHPDKNFKEPF